MSDLIKVRILQHDRTDEIRIGLTTPLDGENSIPKYAELVKKQYEKESEWCGGFAAACEKYYQRIAIVDAETLQELHTIYKRKEESDGKAD